ncbi:peroxiredoxin [Mesoterricola silvestris]|uniref:Peroxidase n=1 Tax=Mesoterricola silvestris TaxID=2927979 RepID=A0AA48GT78_9BACT|nr:peroxiredoxin [Mesoterricola silvestris]BDU73875.1 peroxidase [Mesoterricola silvestris]
MAAFVTQPAPDFKATALVNGEFKEVTLSQYKGKKVVLFFYPLDFTFVCPTEILAFSDAVKEFEARGTQVLGVSVDSHFSHWAWANTEVKNGGIKGVSFPLVSDLSKSIAADYNVLLPGGIALRGLFLVDEAGILRHITVNDLPLGRNVEEVLRVVDALDFHTQHGEVCPANWKKGDKAMKPTQEGLREYAANH